MTEHPYPIERPYPKMPGLTDGPRTVEEERAHRKRMCALGYRIFAAHRWGSVGDGHISARDPKHTDSFWVLRWGVPFRSATVDDLVLVGPDGTAAEADGSPCIGVNTAGYNIHYPVLAARPDAVSAAHTHTPFGTPWSANVRPFRPISQESTIFVFDQAMFDDEEVEVLTVDGGKRIAASLGGAKLVILRNHGLLTAGATVEAAVAWFVMAERVAEVHVKAPDAEPISEEAARVAAETMGLHEAAVSTFWWLVGALVPDPSMVDGTWAGP